MTADGKKTAAVVLAAGSGKRMGTSVHKQYLLIKGKPVIYYTLRAFELSEVDEIILVTGADEIDYCSREIVEKYNFQKVRAVIAGGKERYDSVYEGLRACKDTEYVLIHDGARPFIDNGIIERGLMAAAQTGASVVGMPSKDTVKIADAEGNVSETPDRSSVWIVQTPQIFRYPLIYDAYPSILKKEMTGITDDAMVAEHETGVKIRFSEGSYRNIKITTPEDLVIAEAFLRENRE